MNLEFHTMDVFTQARFGGNPLAIVDGADGLDERLMQTIAREFNLSETIFLQTPEDAANTAKVRIFTPTQELPFAGHPTVGAGLYLASRAGGGERVIRLEEQVGLVPVKISPGEGGALYGELSGAKMPVENTDVPGTGAIAAALGIGTGDIGFDGHAASVFDAGNGPVFVPVTSRAVLARCCVNGQVWSGLGPAGKFGTYIYCAGSGAGKADFHGRFFGPEAGVIEDPATGSAVAAFAGALHKAQAGGGGTHAFYIRQGEDMGRPSDIYLSFDVTGGLISAVRVGGYAVEVSAGRIAL